MAIVTVRLEQLLAAATSGPWEALDAEGVELNVVPWVGRTLGSGEIGAIADELTPADAALIALAPDMARLLIDMGEALKCRGYDHYRNFPEGTPCNYPEEPMCDHCALLARLDALGKDTA